MTTAYISIGNSDDKLSQAEWHRFYITTNRAVREAAAHQGGAVHGQWVSEPASAWQNACWALQLPTEPAHVRRLRIRLRKIAREFSQDSIAWATAPETELLSPDGVR